MTEFEWYQTGVGQTVKTHTRAQCQGEHCCIHNPSNHHMKDWPTLWRDDRKLMERICEHGVGHPDPDDLAFKERMFGKKMAETEAIHGCDGCCSKEVFERNSLVSAMNKK